jgi:LacI family transcriptional regulator, gluconate utilization system Gnt-I transcriptional repressor
MKRPGAGERTRLPKRKSRVTLAEVAKLADVSEITVSRALRNEGQVAEETRLKVRAAADLIGYVPNRIAGSLASARSNVIGVIIPSFSNIVFPEVLRGIHAAVHGSSFQPVVGVTDYSLETEETLVRSLLAWKPAAIVLAGFDHTDATRQMLQRSGIRIAELMDIGPKPLDIAVGFSHRRAGFDIGRYLIGRGYRHFGYIGHDWSADRRARLRYDGLVEAIAMSGLTIAGQALAGSSSSTAAGRAMTAQLLESSPDVDVAVFSNDDMALGGVFHCLTAGVAVPERLAIFGFNGLEIGDALPKRLSTLRSNRFLIGKTAVEKIFESLDERLGPVIVDTGYEIVAGETA